MFANFTWKKFVVVLVVAALLGGFGFAVRYGEDGQVGSDNVLSTWIFVMAGLAGAYALAVFGILIARGARRAPRQDGKRN